MQEVVAKSYIGYWFQLSPVIGQEMLVGPLLDEENMSFKEPPFKVVEVAHGHYRGRFMYKVPDEVKVETSSSKIWSAKHGTWVTHKKPARYIKSWKLVEGPIWTITRPISDLDHCTRLRNNPLTGKRMKNPIKPIRRRDRMHNIDED